MATAKPDPAAAQVPDSPSMAQVSALKTLSTERKGLDALSDAMSGPLGQTFCKAHDLIAGAGGRVVVTGMGKSGHIGSKIAATLASTGTPAFFVHPAEASHGDLGMVTPDDVILALSWSGETAELKSTVFYSRRFRVPMIAMTSRAGSTLANAADVALVLPKINEACPHGLAPTTSSIVQLAMGDALAIALLENRGFSADDFRAFHPGGSLGASLMRVGEIMHTGAEVPLVSSGAPMQAAIDEISQKNFGCVGIVDDAGRLIGIITDGDIRRRLSDDLMAKTVDQVMTANPKTVQPETLLPSALEHLNSASITALMVVDNEKPAGIVHMHDLLRVGAA
jgi:arabinose-5-phosphate isomerase